MLIVAAEVSIEEGSVEPVREALRTMEVESLKEPGCQTYAFSLDISNPGTVRIIERWDSMEDLQAHFAMPHMATFREAIVSIQPKGMEVKVYEVARELELPS